MTTLKAIILASALVSCGVENIERIDNPVLVKRESERIKITQCHEGTLSSKSITVDQDDLRVERNFSGRPYILIKRSWLNQEHAELHIGSGDRFPFYVSYGNSGALTYHASGRYPCPDWQWKD